MDTLAKDTTVHDLLVRYPFLEDFLVAYNPKFELLRNAAMRATLGRVATLERAASVAGVDVAALIIALAAEIKERTQDGIDAVPVSARPQESVARDEGVEAMKDIITELHKGLPFDEAKKRFDEVIRGVEPGQIAQIEESLIRGGMPVSEVQRLCDLHVGVFKSGLDEKPAVSASPGHPVHTYMKENEEIVRLADRLAGFVARVGMSPEAFQSVRPEIREVLEDLQGVDGHYVRKENQLFPFLEKHDITGPSKVMWGIHDEIRAMLKTLGVALEASDASAVSEAGSQLGRALGEMVYKENRILFPMAMETLSPEEWAEVRRGEDDLEYPFAPPAAPFDAARMTLAAAPVAPAAEAVALRTGMLSVEQLTAMLTHLPIEVSFVDADGYVRFYSDNPQRTFPRSPGVIGRHVENCHPPKSVDTVKRILTAFKDGKKDVAEFWIQLEGRFLHIRYFAVRSEGGAFLGTLETTQDVTGIRSLEGEHRLLDWDAPA
jgi:DUF438 domain-containing protein